MTPEDFKRSLAGERPPRGAVPALAALWWIKKGDWNRAHEIVMNAAGADAARVHAHLHRIEGDETNANYWYRQARKAAADMTTDAEWHAILVDLLRSDRNGSS